MSIYVFSLLAGYEFTGVDKAQGIRAGMLRTSGFDPLHFFMTVPTLRELYQYHKYGINTDEMAFAQQWFVEKKGLRFGISIRNKASELAGVFGCDEVIYEDGEILLRLGETHSIILKPSMSGGDRLAEIDYLNNGRQIIREFYTDCLLYREYTDDLSSGLRVYYDSDGRTVLKSWKKDGEEYYQLIDGRTLTYEDFCYLFFDELGISSKDTVIMDRCLMLKFLQPLFEHKNGARFIALFHSDHYYNPNESISAVGLNFEYFYWFRYSYLIDVLVVFTDEHRRLLSEKLEEYGLHVPQICVIPSGGISELRYPQNGRTPYSVMTASRIIERKRIDIAIESVIKAHEKVSQITLDIYGWGIGDYLEKVKKLIADRNAEGYIRLKGFCNVDDLYKNYEVYLSSSGCETMGISVMEAIGSGNAVIGLDVRYGNKAFIKHGNNGYLISADIEHYKATRQQLVDDLAAALVDLFSDQNRLSRFHEYSYERAKNFSVNIIAEKWNLLLSQGQLQ